MAKTKIPGKIIRGEKVEWTVDLTDYPPSEGWSLVYVFRGNTAGASFTVTATTDGDSYVLSFTNATTTGKPLGRYDYQSYVTDGSEKIYIETGALHLLQDLATATAPFDGRSSDEIALAAIDAVLKNKATKDQLSYQIGDMALSRYPISDLLALRDFYASRVSEARRKAAGKSKFKTINTQFTRP